MTSMMTDRIRLALIVVAAAFSAAALFGTYQIRSLQLQLRAAPVIESVWSVSQGDGRLLAFLDTVQRYMREPNEDHQHAVDNQLDILWSRLYVLTRGRARQLASADPAYGRTIAQFTSSLKRVDQLTSPLTPTRAVEVYGLLEKLRVPLHDLLIRSSQAVTLGRARTNARLYGWTHVVGGALLVLLLSGGAAIVMLYRENRRATREMLVRANAEAELRVAKERAEQASRAKSSFLSKMSHELRTPLNAVIGFSELIRTQALGKIGSEKYVEYAGDINVSGTYLLALVSDILDLTALETGDIEFDEASFDLDDVVRECAAPCDGIAGRGGKRFRLDLPQEPIPFVGDRRRVRQMLRNLLTNAFRFTPAGGEVTLSLRRVGDGAAVEVADTGVGIPPDKLEHVFQPFQQVSEDALRSQEGTGLGLSIVKRLADLHQAEVGIDSTVGEGTTVTVTFPPERLQPAGDASGTATSRLSANADDD